MFAFDHAQLRVRLRQLGRGADCVWLAALTIGTSFTLVAAYLFPYPESPSGKFWAYAGLFIRGGLYLWSKESLKDRGGETLFRLFAMGLVAGVLELLIDWGLIHWVKHGPLIYLTGNDVVLLGSPVWMPLAWACVIVEMGYPALRLFGVLETRLGAPTACTVSSLVIGLGAGTTVGFYEYFAYKAGWWKYGPANYMIGDFCPWCIPLGEALMFLAIVPIAGRIVREEARPVSAALVGGSWFALAILAGYAAAYGLLEAGR